LWAHSFLVISTPRASCDTLISAHEAEMECVVKRYPATEKYDSTFVSENWMGPNPLWLLEELCENLDLRPGMRVLDLGCGKGLTSIFLAKEFGVTVFATDLWIGATENFERFKQMGVSDLVFPIHAEAHALPYADGFFDVAIAIDSYHYFGADERYFPETLSKLVRSRGQFGIVTPGFSKEFDKGYPDTLRDFWNDEMWTFKSTQWWRKLWEKTGIAEITACYNMADPKDIWRPYAEWEDAHEDHEVSETAFIDADTNDDLALIVMAAVKK